MTKIILRACVFTAAVAILFSSCKSHEKCPAYGHKAPVKQHTEARS